MVRASTLRLPAFFALLLAACSAASTVTSGSPTGHGPDGGAAGDLDVPDGGTTPADAGKTEADASEEGGRPGDILGTLSGACGVISGLLTSPSPSLVDNLVVFAAGETYTKASLSADGQRLFDTTNAGGSSTESEVMSFEVLHYCDGASLLKTETEITYALLDDGGANTITDVLVAIGGKKVGVSVTRAYRPTAQPLTDAELKALLEKKLEGINRSSQRVLPADKWVKQILHVFSVNKAATDGINRVFSTIDPAIRADTIVLVTETSGGGFVYCNPDPPLGSECP